MLAFGNVDSLHLLRSRAHTSSTYYQRLGTPCLDLRINEKRRLRPANIGKANYCDHSSAGEHVSHLNAFTVFSDISHRIRLSEAHARMRFSDKVEEEDVQEAARLIREALKESATDPTTGLIDVRSCFSSSNFRL